MADEQALAVGRPAGVQRHAEPAGQPVQRFGRGAAHIEQPLRLGDAVLDGGVGALEVGQQPLDETGRHRVFAIDRRQVVLGIGEARVPGAQRPQPRRVAAVTAQHQAQLQVAAAGALEQQFPSAPGAPGARGARGARGAAAGAAVSSGFRGQAGPLGAVGAQVGVGLAHPVEGGRGQGVVGRRAGGQAQGLALVGADLVPDGQRAPVVGGAAPDFQPGIGRQAGVQHQAVPDATGVGAVQQRGQQLARHPVARPLLGHQRQPAVGAVVVRHAGAGHQGPAAEKAHRVVLGQRVQPQPAGTRLQAEGIGLVAVAADDVQPAQPGGRVVCLAWAQRQVVADELPGAGQAGGALVEGQVGGAGGRADRQAIGQPVHCGLAVGALGFEHQHRAVVQRVEGHHVAGGHRPPLGRLNRGSRDGQQARAGAEGGADGGAVQRGQGRSADDLEAPVQRPDAALAAVQHPHAATPARHQIPGREGHLGRPQALARRAAGIEVEHQQPARAQAAQHQVVVFGDGQALQGPGGGRRGVDGGEAAAAAGRVGIDPCVGGRPEGRDRITAYRAHPHGLPVGADEVGVAEGIARRAAPVLGPQGPVIGTGREAEGQRPQRDVLARGVEENLLDAGFRQRAVRAAPARPVLRALQQVVAGAVGVHDAGLLRGC